jgi:uncharacterized protein (UPF0332 family)
LNTIPALIRKAKDSLHGARVLASENLLDFAVGRAYLAMHYVAEAFLLSHKLDVLDPDGVADAFGQLFSNTGELPPIFHRWLIEAKRLAKSAEFETQTGITKDIAAEQLDRARAFVSLGREELTEPFM